MKAFVTSKNTSVNTKKMPAIFSKMAKIGILIKGKSLFDIGCGRPETQKLVRKSLQDEHGIKYSGWDPNWAPETLFENADIVTISNVLNVIPDKSQQKELVDAGSQLVSPGGVMAIAIYEGDKSGIGRISQTDCWQENRKTNDYLKECPDGSYIKNGAIFWHRK